MLNYLHNRTSWNQLSYDNIVIANIENGAQGGIDVSVYAYVTQTTVLNLKALTNAVQVHIHIPYT